LIKKHGCHVSTAELLTFTDDLVLHPNADLFQMMGGFQNTSKTVTFLVDLVDESLEDLSRLDGRTRCIYVIIPNSLDDGCVVRRFWLLGLSSST